MRRLRSLGFSEAMLLIYNKKSQHPLRINKLYSTKKPADSIDESIDEENTTEAEIKDNDNQMSLFSDS